MPFTVHFADVFPAPVTVATNCLVFLTRTEALVGEIVIPTGRGAVTFRYTVFDTSPSGVPTTTGTADLAAGAFPVAVSVVADTNVVASDPPSNRITEPMTN